MSESVQPPQPIIPTGSRLRIGAVVLAAGASSRMGEPKQLLPLGGKPLIIHTTDAALESSIWPVIVVIGAHAEKIRPFLARLPVLVAENPAWAEGMASSLRTGITALQQFSRSIDGALITLCDQPAFSATTIARLMTAQHETGRSIIAARYNGRNGAPAIFLRRHFAALTALTGEEGARALLNTPSDQLTSVDLPELAADIDTKEDYAAAKMHNLS